MLKKEYEILFPFVKEPWKKFTFKDIKKLANKTSESYVYNRLKYFVKEDILKQEFVGNVILYKLTLHKLKTQVFAGFIAEYVAWGKKNLPLKDLQRIAAKIPAIYTLLITGSYARNKQTEKSDVDVVIIIDDCEEPKRIYAKIKFDCEMNIPPMHLYVFKKSEFSEMLLNDEANYGKEIAGNNLILSGATAYYQIINETVQNGFNDEKLH